MGKPVKKAVKNKLPVGRPSKYSDALAERICELIATSSKGIHKLCEEHKDLPAVSTIFLWINAETYFSERYARAREAQAELLADEIITIADFTANDTITVENENGSYDTPNHEWISRSKLRVDARKWKASKLAPKKYGDKTDLTTNGENINPVVVNFIEATKKGDA